MTNSESPSSPPAFIDVGKDGEARSIAVRARTGGAPGLFWLSGYKSDMKGTKAVALARWAEQRGAGAIVPDPRVVGAGQIAAEGALDTPGAQTHHRFLHQLH